MSDRAVDLEPTIDARPVVTDLSEAERNPSINPVPEETDYPGLGDMLRAKWERAKQFAGDLRARLFGNEVGADGALRRIERPNIRQSTVVSPASDARVESKANAELRVNPLQSFSETPVVAVSIENVVPSFECLFDSWVEDNSEQSAPVERKASYIGRDGSRFDLGYEDPSVLRGQPSRLAALANKSYEKSHGARLEAVVSGPNTGVVINTLETQNVRIWESMALGEVALVDGSVIPVASILTRDDKPDVLRVRDLEGGVSRVYSRYAGLPYYKVIDALNVSAERLESCLENGITHVTDSSYTDLQDAKIRLSGILSRQSVRISEQLREAGITFKDNIGNKNTVVEFVSKEYLADCKRKGYTINTFPFDENHVSFDVRDYFREPNRLVPVLRLIDFDDIDMGE